MKLFDFDANRSPVALSAIALVALAGFLAGCPGEDTEGDEAEFSVAIDEDASTLGVDEGSEVTVEAEIENVGDDLGTQDVEFSIDDSVESTEEDVELEVGQTETVSFSWQTEEGDAGTYSAEVASDDDEDTAEVTVEEGTTDVTFEVSINDGESNLEVTEGETAEIGVSVENTGDDNGTQNIDLSLDGNDADTYEDLELDGGESTLITFQWETAEGDAGTYSGEASSEDDSASFDVTVDPQPELSTIDGTLTDADTDDALEGVDVELVDDNGVVDTSTTDGSGEYELQGVENGDYDLRLSAPGLHPDHTIQESSNDNVVAVTVDGDDVTQNLTLGWIDTTDVYVDGGMIEFDFVPATDDTLAVELPGCSEDGGDWTPGDAFDAQPDDDVDVSFDPDTECFSIADVGIDIADGTLEADAADATFPTIQVSVDDSDDDVHQDFDAADIELTSVIDNLGGEVDFTTDGDLDVDLDVRFELGGTLNPDGADLGFGVDADNPDCQLTGGWGEGGLDSPGDAQDNGNYVHDPISFSLTTGQSGDGDAEGVPFDESTGVFVTVDEEATIGRLSEGQFGEDDAGGAACGEFTDTESGADVDVASFINDMLNLPAEAGDVYSEFDFLIP